MASTPTNPGRVPSATRERILDSAEALFAERGFAGTSVRDIAGQVGLTPASLYNHFPSKDALYGAVLDRGIGPLIELLSQRAAGPPASADEVGAHADQIVTAVMEHLRTRPHLPRLIFHESITGGAHISRIARDWVRPAFFHGLAEMKRELGMPWTQDEYPLVMTAWIHMVLGPFAMAPLYRGVLEEDPLSDATLERQTAFLRKLARLIAAASPDV